ncbi:thiamine diphosphokinase [Adlercreutzia faecimuris]|uniref:Thiamine diphosphokinase n=1 Tax=Adlercreutzia faecimuris TaxID=2897341 RepID=A0ABS9WFW2_9ACTN|nr:thiamine diphosphokinase [Adlercreutzia sp. JBNU-10]MCI2241751.1 thiamine diphosphokinase [Adlercreutzia sp. JBNU-10]
MATCALVGASEFNAPRFLEMHAEGAFDYVIAVDGGLAHLEEAGVRADLAIGDFDSLGYVPRGLRVARFPVDKDKSDMELALDRALSQCYGEAYVFGALGGRLDHTLANLQLLASFSERGLYVTAVGLDQAVAFVTGPDVFELPAAEEGTVSVFAMNDACTGVFERGLRWSLDDFTMTNRTSRGLSNELQGEAVVIGVEEGTLAVFLPA